MGCEAALSVSNSSSYTGVLTGGLASAICCCDELGGGEAGGDFAAVISSLISTRLFLGSGGCRCDGWLGNIVGMASGLSITLLLGRPGGTL